jgi:hypothetical protein
MSQSATPTQRPPAPSKGEAICGLFADDVAEYVRTRREELSVELERLTHLETWIDNVKGKGR